MTDKLPKWTREALRTVRELDTTNTDFIYAACEWIAQCRQHDEVELEDVGTVLAWIVSTEVKESDQ